MKSLCKTVLSAVASVLVVACSHPDKAKTETLPLAAVRTQSAEPKSYKLTEQVVGTVRPKLVATLEAKVSGRIEKLLVVPGQAVKKGDFVAELEVREIRAKLDQAIAAQDQAERDLKRTQALLQRKSATQSEFDNAESRSRSARASVAEAEAMLAYATVTAPFDGIVSRKWADVGDLAAPGKPLVQIEDPSSLRFEADVSENLIGQVQNGAVLAVNIPSIGETVNGTISEITPFADSDSRTFLIKVDLPKSGKLRSGLFGKVEIPIADRTSLRIPASSIVQRGQMEIVFVVADRIAHLRLVKTGKHIGDAVEVLAGLDPGEVVVTDGAAALIDGQPVAEK